MSVNVTQAVVVERDEMKQGSSPMRLALFDKDGNPVALGGSATTGFTGEIVLTEATITVENGIITDVEVTG